MLVSLSFAVGVVVGWFTTKPVWVDTIVNKLAEKIVGLFKK